MIIEQNFALVGGGRECLSNEQYRAPEEASSAPLVEVLCILEACQTP